VETLVQQDDTVYKTKMIQVLVDYIWERTTPVIRKQVFIPFCAKFILGFIYYFIFLASARVRTHMHLFEGETGE